MAKAFHLLLQKQPNHTGKDSSIGLVISKLTLIYADVLNFNFGNEVLEVERFRLRGCSAPAMPNMQLCSFVCG